MANGHFRDSVRTDILLHRIPTLSPEVDDCFRQIARLSDTSQLVELECEVEQWLRQLERSSVSRWLGDPSIYLADLAPQQVGALGDRLKDQLADRRRVAEERGWEVE